MADDRHGIFVVSANQVCCDHIERLCRQEGYPAPRIVSDPGALSKLLASPTGAEPPHHGGRVAGIILDLTTPQPRSQHPTGHAPDTWEATNTKEAAEMVACLIAVALSMCS